MKLLENPNKIIKIGEVGEEQVFHLAATSAAFDILSSNIYLYPIRACVREYSCNARDAQVYVGNDPSGFQVHLPSNYYPQLSHGTEMGSACGLLRRTLVRRALRHGTG
jgi:hypothetical protein